MPLPDRKPEYPNVSLMLPRELLEALQRIVIDKVNGNIKINFADGEIRTFHVETVTRVK